MSLPRPAPDPIILSNHILAIPKLDKAKFISSYLQEQTAHAKSYASQGRALVSSWKYEDSGYGRRPSKLLVLDYGFGTPVLKPRVVMRAVDDIERPLERKDEAAIVSKNTGTQSHAVEPNQEQHIKRKRTMSGSPPKAMKQKPRSGKARGRRKQDSGSDPESEHAKRLKERRTRKRAKRAITKPATDVDTGNETLSERTIAAKVKTKKVLKTKIPGGLALMHGFSATNVGAGRLTVKPLLSVGVFNKGKASVKTSKRPVKEGRVNSTFTEKNFLNKTRKASEPKKEKRKRISSSSSVTDTLTTRSEEDLGIHKRIKARRETRKWRKLQDLHSGQDTASHLAKKQTKDLLLKEDNSVNRPKKACRSNHRPDSIIWDIELDDASLPSERMLSRSGKRSVLLNTCHIAWGDPSIRPLEIDLAAPQHQSPDQETSGMVDITAAQRSSSSISPSESASQYGQHIPRCDVPVQEASSKYFALPMIGAELPTASLATAACLQGALEQSTSRTSISSKNDTQDDNINRKPNPTIHLVSSPLKPLFPLVPSMEEAVETVNYEIIDFSTNSLDYLPEVDPQDYRYSDGDVHLLPLEDIGWHDGLLRVITDEHGNLYTDDELSCGIGDNNTYLSFHQWHELEGSFRDELYGGVTEYEEEEADQVAGTLVDEEDDSLSYNDDGCHPPECISTYSPDAQKRGDGSGNIFSLRDSTFSGGGHITYESDSLEDDSEEMSRLSTSGDLELDTNEDGGSVDFTASFAQGRALLLGYSEQGVRPMGLFPRSSRRREVSLVEADVARGLRNHWLPQRL